MTTRKRPPGAGTVDRVGRKFRARLPRNAAGDRPTLGMFDDEDEAHAILDAALVKLADAGRAPTGGWTWKAWGEHRLEERELAGQSSVKTDAYRWKLHLVSAPFADWLIANIRPAHVRAWLDALSRKKTSHKWGAERKKNAEKLSRQSVKHCLNLARRFFQDAVDREVIATNPALGLQVKKERRTDEGWTYLEPDEQRRLLEATPPDHRCLVAFAIGSGLREGELYALELADVHVGDDEAEPHVVVRYGGRNHKPTKGGKPRVIYLFGLALTAMRTWLKHLPEWVEHNPKRLVFPTKRGCMRPERKAPRGWHDWVKAAGIVRRVRWHDLRHTCASSLVCGWWGRRWTLEEVREYLGHSSITVTQRYAHLATKVLQSAAKSTRGPDGLGGLGPAQPPPAPPAPPALPPPAAACPEDLGSAWVKLGSNGAQADEITQHAAGLTSRMSQVQALSRPPAEKGCEVASTTSGHDPALTHALAVLRAAAARDESAHEHARALAQSVLDAPSVRLALDVLDGPEEHALSRGIELASLVLEGLSLARRSAAG